MLRECALQVTDLLYRKCRLEENRRNVYIYGCELTISTLLGVLSMTLISILFFRLTDIVAFLLFFMVPRFFSGGFHAKTYGRCFVLSNSLFLCSCFLISLILFTKIWWLPLLLAGISAVVIIKNSPIRNAKHPLSETSYERNKTISRVLTVIQLAVLVAMSFFQPVQAFYTAAGISMLANAFMMIIAIIERRTVQ